MLEAIAAADIVVIAPSNPIVVDRPDPRGPGILDALRQTDAPVVGVSPIIGGAPVRGMADVCLRVAGVACTASGVAAHYGARSDGGVLDAWLIAEEDHVEAAAVEGLGIRSAIRPLWMTDAALSRALGEDVLAVAASATPQRQGSPAMSAEREMTTIDTIDEAERLLGADGEELERLLDRAARMRDAGLQDAGRPGVITYSRKVFVPLTTLCRDRCHYCIFVDTPGQLLTKRAPMYMSDEQVLQVVRAGAAHGCKEALLTLGDRPEDRWPQARAWLDEHGFASTLDYVGHVARLITRETGLLAHLNPGVMSADELRALRPTAPSMGMMLETTSRELYETPGSVHYGSPDKDPAVRLQVIADAGSAGIPFTTGILVGIGETLRDRAESLFALRDLHAEHGQIQEVIVQNFRAKHATAMRGVADASLREHVAAIAVARLIIGPDMRIQAPPNLADAEAFDLLVRAGIDDWGGVSPVTADHVNPERPWPDLDDLAALTAASGFTLRERLTAHPEYIQDPQRWFDPAIQAAVAALADPATGLARTDAGATAPLDPEQRHHTSGGVAGLVGRAVDDPTTLDDAEWVACSPRPEPTSKPSSKPPMTSVASRSARP